MELVKKQHEKAGAILRENREKLDELARFLYEMVIWPSILLFSAGFIIGAYLILLGVDNIAAAFHEP